MKKKSSLFEKFFELAEESGNVPEEYQPANYEETIDYIEDVKVPTAIDEELINNTYAENDLSDLTKSIFKVEMFMNTLPAEMPADVKRNTVLGILKASGITEDEVRVDALTRIEVLQQINLKLSGENTELVQDAAGRIDQLKAEIDNLNKVIYDANNAMAKTTALIASEVERVEALKKFIEMNGGK